MNELEISGAETTTLSRPVGQQEVALIEANGFGAFPPRLPEQPIFYPALNESYATQIARDWNASYNTPRVGYVLRFRVRSRYLDRYQIHRVGATIHQEYWIPAEEPGEFNRNIVGKIEIAAEYRGDDE